MNILMVYPKFPDTFWSFKHALKFIDKKAANPPLGLVTIAAMLPKDWDVKLVDINIEELRDRDIQWADLVFISAMTVQRESVLEIIDRCHALSRKIVAGGPLFSCEPDGFTEVDHLILNEGEITFKEFLKDFSQGIARKVYQTDEFCDVSDTPLPRFELLKLNHYDAMSVQFSRGCPFHCDFCNVTALLGHKPRLKSTEQFIAELDYLYLLGWRRNIFVVDDNFIGNKRVLKDEILPAMIQWKAGKKGCNFITEASVNLADDEELMRLMTDAGFTSVFVGIETPSEEGLAECHKSQNTKRNLLDNVHKMERHGLQVMAGFIVGFDSDTPSIFQRQFEFIQESGIVTAMVGLLQAPAGTELYRRLASEGRIQAGFSGDNGDGGTNVITRMDINTLKDGYQSLVRKLFRPDVVYNRIKVLLDHFRPQHEPVSLTWTEIKALVRAITWIGFAKETAKHFWDLVISTIIKYPSRLPMAVTMSVYAYHFRKMSLEHIQTGNQSNDMSESQMIPA
jgi:radical SAM superfamily enzyme YgiQ (UPF0313 family)